MPGDFEVDTAAWESFARTASKEHVAQAARIFYERGGLLLESLMKADTAKRVGVETSESRMQVADSSRPKGLFLNSIMPIQGPDGVRVGPVGLAYAGWVILGHEAPDAPASHKKSLFRGHRIIDHARAEAPQYLVPLLSDVLRQVGVK